MISIIVPVKNEEKNVTELHSLLKKNLRDFKYQLIFIDDGSTDGTYKELQKLKDITLLKLRKNYGKSTALMHGIKHAKGDLILMMDGDLEDKPDQIGKFVVELWKGYDCVVGWRKHRKHTAAKRTFSKIFNTLSVYLSGLKIHDANCGFKLMTKTAADSLDLHGELHRYIPVLLHNNGFKVSEVVVEHADRKHGVTKYGAFRIIVGFIDLITVTFLTKYSQRPSQLFSLIGFGFVGLSGITGLLALYRWIMHGPTITSITLMSLFFISGLIIIMFGLIAELMISKRNGNGYQIEEVQEQ